MELKSLLSTACVLLIFIIMICLKRRNCENENSFFTKEYTTALKGLAAIVVIFVHVPADYSNVLQDAIGSFGYVAVTFFFLVSSYGMQLAVENKQGYMTTFWKNRLSSLLIPMIIINIVNYGANYLFSGVSRLPLLIKFNEYVAVLLSYRLWFWCLEIIGNYFRLNRKTTDLINISGVLLSSLCLYFLGESTGWCYERLGLVWGVLLYRYFPAMLNWIKRRNLSPKIIFIVASLVLGVLYLKYKYVYFWGAYMLKIVLGVVLLMCLFLWSYRRNFNNRILLFLGGISYEIYLFHTTFMLLMRDYFAPPAYLFIPVTVVSTIVLAYLIDAVSKPLIRKLRSN